jgi:multimeric flavodoxin WrbA
MVLGISGSARVWGNCETAVKTALIAAADQGATTGFVRLPDLRIECCRGCFACLSGEGRCAIDDDLETLLDRMDAADGLVLACPVYFGLPPASLVGLLDRLLVRTPREGTSLRPRGAVTITLMGNSKWRGLAEPVINSAVSLLGFDLFESLTIVAEGPGEVLTDPVNVARLQGAGRDLAGAVTEPVRAGGDRAGHRAPKHPANLVTCPVCHSDFVRLEADVVECPVCGERGDLTEYFQNRRFRSLGGERRWGRAWLRSHADSWIRPSVARYKAKRRDALRQIAEIKRRYSALESPDNRNGPGDPDRPSTAGDSSKPGDPDRGE